MWRELKGFMETFYLAVGFFVVNLSLLAVAAAVGFFAYKGAKQHLREVRLGRGCVVLTEDELMGRER